MRVFEPFASTSTVAASAYQASRCKWQEEEKHFGGDKIILLAASARNAHRSSISTECLRVE